MVWALKLIVIKIHWATFYKDGKGGVLSDKVRLKWHSPYQAYASIWANLANTMQPAIH